MCVSGKCTEEEEDVEVEEEEDEIDDEEAEEEDVGAPPRKKSKQDAGRRFYDDEAEVSGEDSEEEVGLCLVSLTENDDAGVQKHGAFTHPAVFVCCVILSCLTPQMLPCRRMKGRRCRASLPRIRPSTSG